ncbi:MAG: 50S ribosomal protein L13 [Candidatus Hydrogenedentota bacterium]|nr:MAG: 50S ribosomal protein L13 [Candidatus Hydrogenedentota bacterium]
MNPLYGQQTTVTKKENIEPYWVLIDAEGKTLGRLVSQIAFRLQGKHLPNYQPGVYMGENFVIVNAAKIKVTGNKMQQKEYIRHTGYMGGLRKTTLQDQLQKDPSKVILHALKGMLPKNRLSRKLLKKVRVFPDENHNLQALKPEKIELSA